MNTIGVERRPFDQPAVQHAKGGVALETVDLCRVYGATTALDGVSISVQSGEIHGLLGENGAGKSTLVRILAGLEPQDSGQVKLFGRTLPAPHTSALVAELGCAFIHQNAPVVGDLTVAENIALVTGFAMRFGLIDTRECRRRAREAMERLGFVLDVDTSVSELPLSTRAIVAIARALALNARLIFLDEPTASLHAEEVATLLGILNRLRNGGVAVVLISHRIDEVSAACDRVSVLRNGRLVTTVAARTSTRTELVNLIVGAGARPTPAVTTPPQASIETRSILKIDQLRSPGIARLSLEAYSGQILGITGLDAAGHAIVGEAISGIIPVPAGSMTLGGSPYAPAGIAQAVRLGVVFLPADRGAATSLTLTENLFMNPRRRWYVCESRRAERRRATKLLSRFGVRPADPDREMSTLSGGNQQKVVVGKLLAGRPRLLILNNPTAAVDVGAKVEIYRLLRKECSDRGAAIILISSDFEEIAEVCDRAIVMFRGEVQQVLAGAELTAAGLTQAAYGSDKVESAP